MAGNVRFEDYTDEVAKAMEKAALTWLEEAAGEVEAQTQRNSRVGETGKTKGSYRHVVDKGAMEATVGSDYNNAIWEEYGTGLYAEKGGRTDVPWHYQDAEGKWHTTSGKRPNKPFRKAYKATKGKLIKRARALFKGM